MIQSSSAMSQVFFGLKENWWKQVYDGEYHRYGWEVFDKGLHGRNVEPGFYNSIKKASEYAGEQLGSPLTIECYKRIHTIACAHFPEVDRRVINVDKADIDNFRNNPCGSARNLAKEPYHPENSEESEIRRINFALLYRVQEALRLNERISTETGSKREWDAHPLECRKRVMSLFMEDENYFKKKGFDVRRFFDKGNPFYESVIQSKESVTKQLKTTQKKLKLSKPFATLRIDASNEEILVFIKYNYKDPEKIEKILHLLIDQFNKKMRSLPSNPNDRSIEENKFALGMIAELFQNLEWLHPFFDGQGRTDLVLLAKLLTEQGFNPSILYYPYFSTFEPLEKWIAYLEKGIEAWKKEREDTGLYHQSG